MSGQAVRNEDFDFSAPGTYLVRWHYRGNSAHGGWDGEIESNELRIEIE